MRVLKKTFFAFLTLSFLIVAFSLCVYAVGGERYEASTTDELRHNVIINGMVVGTELHRSDMIPTCMSRAVCRDCYAEFGEFAPHSFYEATCTNPKTCSVCDYQERETIPHSGGEAKCLERAVCSGCFSEYGDILGHTGGEATCSSQAICTRCDEPYGATSQHTGGKATCQTGAICTVCSAEYGELGECVPSGKWCSENDFHYQPCQENGCTTVFNDSDHTDENKDGKACGIRG